VGGGGKGHTLPQPLILPTDKHGRHHIAKDKQQQKYIMPRRPPRRIKHTQQNQPHGPHHGKHHGQPGQHLLPARRVGRQATPVAQPAVGAE
jgi:hypothetical protein